MAWWKISVQSFKLQRTFWTSWRSGTATLNLCRFFLSESRVPGFPRVGGWAAGQKSLLRTSRRFSAVSWGTGGCVNADECLSEEPERGAALRGLSAVTPGRSAATRLAPWRFLSRVCFCSQNALLQETVRRECEERYELTAALTQAREQVLELKKLSGNFPLSPRSLTRGSVTSSAYGQQSRGSRGAGKEISVSGQFGMSRAAKAPTSGKRNGGGTGALPAPSPPRAPRGRTASLNEPRSGIAAAVRRQLSQLWRLQTRAQRRGNDHLVVHPGVRPWPMQCMHFYSLKLFF